MITCITKDVNKMLNKKEFDILSAYAMNKSSEEKVPERLLKNGLILNGTISAAGLEELEKYKVKRAVFIAAGFGSRLVPITLNTPKPLVRVHGKRIIDGLIDACLQAGINDIVIVRGYLGEEFDQLKSKYPMIKFMDNPYYNTTRAKIRYTRPIPGTFLKDQVQFQAPYIHQYDPSLCCESSSSFHHQRA